MNLGARDGLALFHFALCIEHFALSFPPLSSLRILH
jgi:hypothetical protein